MLHNEEDDDLVEFLDKNYPIILDSIKNEGYVLEYTDFFIFYELYWQDELAGFVSINMFHIIATDMVINECYVLPEFRGNGLLTNILFHLMANPNIKYHIRNPNKAIINVLLKNGFAFKFSDNLVASYIKFVADLDTVYKNPKIKRFYKTPDIDIPYKANIFDLNLCSVVLSDPMLNFIKYHDVVALTLPRKGDLKKYKLRKKLKRVTEKYLDTCYEERIVADDEIQKHFDGVEDEIYEFLSVENILGTEDMLDDDFKQCLDDYDLSDEDGFKIIRHISTALENDDLTVKGIIPRMQYLVRNIDKIDGVQSDDEERCPFCGEYKIEFLNSCEVCGQKLRDIPYEEEFGDKLENFNPDDILNDFYEGKFREILDSDEFWGRVPIEEDDPYYELKTYYNEHLTAFDFDEIRQFYDESDKSLPIVEIFEDYIDSVVLNKQNDEKFSLYKEFLVILFYYHMDEGRFDEALTYLIQLVILASNAENRFGGDVIHRTPHVADITYEIEHFLEHAGDYDLEGCLDEAFATFKVDEWNNNREEITETIHEYL